MLGGKSICAGIGCRTQWNFRNRSNRWLIHPFSRSPPQHPGRLQLHRVDKRSLRIGDRRGAILGSDRRVHVEEVVGDHRERRRRRACVDRNTDRSSSRPSSWVNVPIVSYVAPFSDDHHCPDVRRSGLHAGREGKSHRAITPLLIFHLGIRNPPVKTAANAVVLSLFPVVKSKRMKLFASAWTRIPSAWYETISPR